ncbi:hypothetical protein [Aurantivibrio infirmus]
MNFINNFRLIIPVGLMLLANITLAEPSIEEALENTCGNCHTAPGKQRTAPPLFAVKRHLLKNFPERDSFIEHVVEWVANPSEDRALMHGAVKKFGLMPPQTFTTEHVRKIAAYIYDTELPSPMGSKMHSGKGHQGMEHGENNESHEHMNHKNTGAHEHNTVESTTQNESE